MDGIVLIIVLALTGGAIAYIGDRLGTRIGKRKLTVFGLRPRHTSTLITIVSGFLIVAATMGALTIVSQDVRTALFGMEKLKAELTTLSGEIIDKNQELERNRQELEAKTVEYAALLKKIEETGQRMKMISLELIEVQGQRDRIEQELKNVQQEHRVAIAGLEAAKKELDRKVEELTATRDNLQADAERLQAISEKLRQGIQTVREGAIVFRSGEMLNSAVLESAANQTEQDKALRSVLTEANQKLLKKFEIEKPDMELLWLPQGDFERVSQQLQQEKGSYVVRVFAAGNIVYGEPVVATLGLVKNQLIYSSGAAVYSQVMHIGSRENEASEALLFFLRQVNSSATKNGVLPDPLRGTVGVMDGMEFYDTVAKMRQAAGSSGSNVKVIALAQEDVYTVGPLRLKFRIERVD